jgi:hypothetical protein
MMIEVRIDLYELRKIQHNITHSIRMIEALKAAGIPVAGILITHGVERGTMIWLKEEDLDDESWVIKWYDTDEDMACSKWRLEASGSGQAYRWRRFADARTPVVTVDDDDEL